MPAYKPAIVNAVSSADGPTDCTTISAAQPTAHWTAIVSADVSSL
jgi:hypothetical protein